MFTKVCNAFGLCEVEGTRYALILHMYAHTYCILMPQVEHCNYMVQLILLKNVLAFDNKLFSLGLGNLTSRVSFPKAL